MNREIVDELMTWTMEAILKPNIQELQDIKKKALQANDHQLVEFCSRFEQAIQNKQQIQPIFKELLEVNNKNIIRRVDEKLANRKSSEDLEL
jgi:hypothetical protein